ncbi:MAG: polymorphic toxin type 50 domain-containing protein [Oscillospiraceae bacterium]|nr:polymorphic toxin type 50 domain-containing protein [Oscillospiraceae bacterium]
MLKEVTGISFNETVERQKILDGTYPNRIIQGRQNKHIEGTKEFEQNCEKMHRLSPGSRPAVLTSEAKMLVDKFKGTGEILPGRGSSYPIETINAEMVIGKTWVKSLQKYVDTKRFRIIYSSNGGHIVPISDFVKG